MYNILLKQVLSIFFFRGIKKALYISTQGTQNLSYQN